MRRPNISMGTNSHLPGGLGQGWLRRCSRDPPGGEPDPWNNELCERGTRKPSPNTARESLAFCTTTALTSMVPALSEGGDSHPPPIDDL